MHGIKTDCKWNLSLRFIPKLTLLVLRFTVSEVEARNIALYFRTKRQTPLEEREYYVASSRILKLQQRMHLSPQQKLPAVEFEEL